MDILPSMKAELDAWNDGAGIDLESWVGCEGRFALAVGYSCVFWPEFVEFEGYILRQGFAEESLREFAKGGRSRKSVEGVMNHFHIADIQHRWCEDLSKDKILHLGRVLTDIHKAKLQWDFPDKECTVEFIVPTDEDDLNHYQLSFWQSSDQL